MVQVSICLIQAHQVSAQLLDLDIHECLFARVVQWVMIPIWPFTLLSLILGDCVIHNLIWCVVQQLGALQVHMFVSNMHAFTVASVNIKGRSQGC
jgi:hypothetical protein